jgi:hypothetical protein
MRLNEFQANYKQMAIEQLAELAAQIDDLVPEAKIALLAELKSRGISQSDIETHSSRNTGSPVEQHAEASHLTPSGDGASHEKESVYMLKGPPPADWIQIPSFSINESLDLAHNMEQHQIPFKIAKAQGFGSCQCLLFVPKDKFSDAITALKEHYGLTDEEPELFSGDCPACGTKLDTAATCSDCGLVLSQSGWDAMRGHPFVKFLEQNGTR